MPKTHFLRAAHGWSLEVTSLGDPALPSQPSKPGSFPGAWLDLPLPSHLPFTSSQTLPPMSPGFPWLLPHSCSQGGFPKQTRGWPRLTHPCITGRACLRPVCWFPVGSMGWVEKVTALLYTGLVSLDNPGPFSGPCFLEKRETLGQMFSKNLPALGPAPPPL